MTSLDLAIIKARLDKASPGPWRALTGARKVSVRDIGLGAPPVAVASPLVLANDECIIGEIGNWMEDGDRDLIVNARTDIERLSAEVRLLRALLRDVINGNGLAAAAAGLHLNDGEAVWPT